MNVCVRFKTQKVARRLQRGGVMDVAVLTEEQRAERQTQIAVTIDCVCLFFVTVLWLLVFNEWLRFF